MNGYPSDAQLEAIKNADTLKIGFSGMIGLIKDAYNSFYGTVECHDDGDFLYLATGGWSGNESVIEALQSNLCFWGFSWVQSIRGGGHSFRNWKVKSPADKEAKP